MEQTFVDFKNSIEKLTGVKDPVTRIALTPKAYEALVQKYLDKTRDFGPFNSLNEPELFGIRLYSRERDGF